MPRHNELEALKAALRDKGWSHQAAADALGRTRETVTRVLNGHRESRTLVRELKSLSSASRTKATR